MLLDVRWRMADVGTLTFNAQRWPAVDAPPSMHPHTHRHERGAAPPRDGQPVVGNFFLWPDNIWCNGSGAVRCAQRTTHRTHDGQPPVGFSRCAYNDPRPTARRNRGQQTKQSRQRSRCAGGGARDDSKLSPGAELDSLNVHPTRTRPQPPPCPSTGPGKALGPCLRARHAAAGGGGEGSDGRAPHRAWRRVCERSRRPSVCCAFSPPARPSLAFLACDARRWRELAEWHARRASTSPVFFFFFCETARRFSQGFSCSPSARLRAGGSSHQIGRGQDTTNMLGAVSGGCSASRRFGRGVWPRMRDSRVKQP
ncbi:hypothetical protein BC628DRAFT_1095852 [Trametes gibbosa]|nr:hypothetical protein BC628DRAFT_1095852 [Trametes gibbosa]